MSRVLKYLGLFLLSLFWFTLFQPWGTFRDPDAFYHTRITDLTLQHSGIVRELPSLDLTSLGTLYADQHWLFHILTIPFQQLAARFIPVDGIAWGQAFASVFFAALTVLVFSFCLQRWQTRHSWFWTASFLLAVPLVFRYSLAKASPLAGLLFVLGTSFFFPSTKNPNTRRDHLAIFFISLTFALTHGGWTLLLAIQACLLIGYVIYERFVKDETWRNTLRKSAWSRGLASLLGVLTGLLIHPNGLAYFRFLWIQVIKIGVLTPSRVILGDEWASQSPIDLLTNVWPLCLVALMIFYGILFARRTSIDEQTQRRSLSLFLATATLAALSIKSQRMMEYFVPILILTLSQLATLVDLTALRQDLSSLRLLRRIPAIPVLLAITCTCLIFVGRDLYLTHKLLIIDSHPFAQFRPAMQLVANEAVTSTRIFHADWDQWPILFYQAPNLHYISGMDPTFLLEARPDLSDLHRDLLLGHATSTSLYEIIHDEFQSQYVFVSRGRRPQLEQRLGDDARFERIYEDKDAQIFRVK